jgi:hypothetical protein
MRETRSGQQDCERQRFKFTDGRLFDPRHTLVWVSNLDTLSQSQRSRRAALHALEVVKRDRGLKGALTSGHFSLIAMMWPTHLWQLYDLTQVGRLNGSAFRRVFLQR